MSSQTQKHPRILFFAGSARKASHNMRLAELGAKIAEANGIPSTFADLGDYPLPLYDADFQKSSGIPENAKKFEALMRVHTGVFIACPEYNASITPLLKNLLDWLSRIRNEGDENLTVFKTRVFALGSSSPGGMGGLRGLNTVRTVLEMGLGALVLPEQFAVPRAMEAYDEHGHLKNKESQEQFKALIHKLARAVHFLQG
ncbi:MAG: NADPH-dependent FMN reductase [Hyphomicrobium sp.]